MLKPRGKRLFVPRLAYGSLALLLFTSPLFASDWYRWRGPDLDGISQETGWQSTWPDSGPKRLWKAFVGTGFSGITVSHGHAYTMGNAADVDTVWCLDASTGAILWKHSYPAILDPHYYEGGPSATPTVDGDRVYTMSKKGDLFCLDAAKGTVVWSRNVHKDLGDEVPTWGFAGSALVEGNLVILNVGAAGTALDKMTGKTVWTSGKTSCGYATPVAFDAGGERRVAIMSFRSLEVVQPATGKSAWSYPWKTEYDINASDPVLTRDGVFISSGCGHGAALLKVADGQPSLVWQNADLQTHICSCIIWQGCIYGVHDTADGSELRCLDLATGAVKWTNTEFGKGSLMLADGKLIGMSDKGELIVAEPTPAEFRVISRAQVLGGKCWTVPTLANGRVYCRNAKGDLVCLDVSGS
jgi:outer membrane protein assembly factor BamB